MPPRAIQVTTDMNKTFEQIKNYIQLHTAEMDDADYINIMRSIEEWSRNQADLTECREDNDIINSIDE